MNRFRYGLAVVTVVAIGLVVLAVVGRSRSSEQVESPVNSELPRTVTVAPTTPSQVVTPTRAPIYVFPIQGCSASASASHHDYAAADIFVRVGCRFVSPVDGQVDEVSRVDRWDPRTNVGSERGGLAVSVVGRDGVRYYGSHLSTIGAGIRPGVQVRAGQVLGLTGQTGSARFTPAHLHFGISWPTPAERWWIRRGTVPPQAFLAGLRVGRPASPVAAVSRAKATFGSDVRCRSYC
ncbi:peptidase M23-like protein [Kribbella sp. VKM Ac-2527]|uniref:Peptidase M23-like protein n=1 Tax=Kribbella caucasensis TaxID=2512215 RepID=A0A4R6KRD1_9ACTN|nr:M23 family metallopeptidase [Kribbella sp. VKM Ac-2527]TDO54734.1 peptidase M23-like protein [Kribbella sp. VKM Ac-2527]